MRAQSVLGVLSCLLWAAAVQAGALPFALFDAHIHPVSDDTQRYPRVPAGAAPGTASAPNIHAPVGIGGKPGVPVAQTDIERRVLGWMDEEGVEGIAAIQKRGSYGTDNRYLLDMADAHPTRLRAVAILDAQQADMPQRLRDMIAQHALAGLRLTGAPSAQNTYPWLDSAQARASWQVANAAGIVMDIMITNEDNSQYGVPAIIRLAKAYPRVRIVLDHMLFPAARGAPDFGLNAAYAAMAQQKNIYFKFTTINLDVLQAAGVSAPQFLRRAIDVYGADHIMWGSDGGNSAGDYHDLVARMVAASAALTEHEQRQILHDTGSRVFASRASRQDHAARPRASP